MGVSGQLYTPAILPQVEGSLVLIIRVLGGPHSWSERFLQKGKYFSLPGSEAWTVQAVDIWKS